MKRLEVSCAVRRIYTSLGAKGKRSVWWRVSGCIERKRTSDDESFDDSFQQRWGQLSPGWAELLSWEKPTVSNANVKDSPQAVTQYHER